MAFKPLPIGVDDFRKIIEKGYYYVDKTLFIKDLMDLKGEVNLFTRPRRFGKTLNMSMLRYFFEINNPDAKHMFEGLAIMDAGEAYTKYMSRYPVITISLKSLKQVNYELAYMQMKKMLAEEFGRHDYILNSDMLTEAEKKRYREIRDVQGSESDYLDAIKFLSACLMKHYGQKTIILIDEYDVPLENSYFGGFYNQMVAVIRSLFESALKTNENLEFAVITGCLRISKESIFTGLNNLKIISVTDTMYAEHFGFTTQEVDKMLQFYGRDAAMDTVKRWYDGYLFGETFVYNPWSVINYVEQIWANAKAFPKPFWSNTSSNSIIRNLVEHADIGVRQEIEALIQGKSIEKLIQEDITYEDIGRDKAKENLWNFLYFTGYLKKTSERMGGNIRYISLAIPNEEVRYIYKNTVLSWFDHKVRKKDLTLFYESIVQGNIDEFEKTVTDMLREGISFYDNKEAFYHGFLMGLFSGMKDFYASSNRESGDGRYDICLKSLDVNQPVMILELKVANSYQDMETQCQQALHQIETRHYEEGLIQDGYQQVMLYGIAFYKKNCRVMLLENRLSERVKL